MHNGTLDPATGIASSRLARNEEVGRLLQQSHRGAMAHARGILAWRSWGTGQPTLLLHGSHGGWPHWVRNIAALAVARHVVAPDLPGFGESDPPADMDDPQAHADLVAAALPMMNASGLGWDIVAFSLGALVACRIAVRYPAAVRRIVLVDAGGLATPMRLADFRGMKGLDAEQRREVNRHNLGAMMLHDPASIDDLALEIAAHYGPLTRTRMQFHVIPDKVLDAVRLTRSPIDLIWGEHDFAHPDPEANAAAVRRYHPEAQLRVVAGAGHWSMYECPAGFNAALIDLLAQPVRAPLPA